MATSTQVEANSKPIAEAIIEAAPKVTTAISALTCAENVVADRVITLAETIKSESKKNKYSKKDAIAMVFASWVVSHGMEDATPAEKKAFIDGKRPVVARIIGLAFCEGKQRTEVDKAKAINAKLPANAPTSERIGVNNLYELARGNTTVAQIIAKRVAKKAAKKSALDTVSTPSSRWIATLKGACESHKLGEKGRLTEDEAIADASKAIREYIAGLKKAAK